MFIVGFVAFELLMAWISYRRFCRGLRGNAKTEEAMELPGQARSPFLPSGQFGNEDRNEDRTGPCAWCGEIGASKTVRTLKGALVQLCDECWVESTRYP